MSPNTQSSSTAPIILQGTHVQHCFSNNLAACPLSVDEKEMTLSNACLSLYKPSICPSWYRAPFHPVLSFSSPYTLPLHSLYNSYPHQSLYLLDQPLTTTCKSITTQTVLSLHVVCTSVTCYDVDYTLPNWGPVGTLSQQFACCKQFIHVYSSASMINILYSIINILHTVVQLFTLALHS